MHFDFTILAYDLGKAKDMIKIHYMYFLNCGKCDYDWKQEKGFFFSYNREHNSFPILWLMPKARFSLLIIKVVWNAKNYKSETHSY